MTGRLARVARSTRDDKKYMVELADGRVIHFGAKGYTVAPGTERGDNYCSRSAGIKTSGPASANYWARRLWGCNGAKSSAERAIKLGQQVSY